VKTIYKVKNQKNSRFIIIAGIVSLIAYITVLLFPSKEPLPCLPTAEKAAKIMKKSIFFVSDYCKKKNIKIDEKIDPNHTGLIGPEYTPLVTTLGNLEAKRTTTNPVFAGLLVHLLQKAGVVPGDTIAVGCSGSFPALMIAILSAARAMSIHPVVIISLGASSYGATNVDFNLLHIYKLLLDKNVFDVPPAAVSLGGEADIGKNFDPLVKEKLIKQIQKSGVNFLYEPDLRRNVIKRMKIYTNNFSGNRISAFVNAGGSQANLGTSNLVLKLKPGLNRKISIPPEKDRGVIFEMAIRKIPIIHLLFIKGLVTKYGIPWDPVQISGNFNKITYSFCFKTNNLFFWIAGIYFFLLILIFIAGYKNKINILSK